MKTPENNVADAVLQFLERINQHDADRLAELMTEDHRFVDSLGQSVCGRENMRSGWRSYFAFCPDYWVTHEELFQSGDRVAVFGAAWLAIVDRGLVQQWRVYADNKPVYEIIARSKPISGR